MHNSSAVILVALGVWKSKNIILEKLSVNCVFIQCYIVDPFNPPRTTNYAEQFCLHACSSCHEQINI